MKIDFCDTCGAFESVKRVNGKNICLHCLGESTVKIDSRFESVLEAENNIRKSQSRTQVLERVHPITLEQENNIYSQRQIREKTKTFLETISIFLENNIGIVFTINSLSKKLKIPKRNIEHCIYLIRKKVKIYSRAIFDYNRGKRYSIYSQKIELIERWRKCELQVRLNKFLMDANEPLSTSMISQKLNVSNSTVLKCVRKYLQDKIMLYRLESENFYVHKKSGVNIYSFYPIATRIK